uniref:NADH dehydrogenase subunit 6 n=1 Tax=Zhengitettix curvispinus TaxID=2793214 RepID=A0A7U3QC68_9ORTH|nr:NADH dehydrogenase subunit 6 [Zhengitettix curvispinus]
MKMIMMIASLLTFYFMKSKPPNKPYLLLLLYKPLMTSFMMNIYMTNTWFSYLLMIIFIGGMMVLFIYITSIVPNENDKKNKMLIMISLTMLIMLTMINIKYYNYFKTPETVNMNYYIMNQEYMMLNKIFNKHVYMLYITMMIYLFIALMAVNMIFNVEKGPLRKKN